MSEQRCANPPRRASTTACAACARQLCADCVVHTNVGFKCASCTGGKAAVT
ncbi:MAG: rhomboid family intramembrane serine protease, partial [Actinobacteria bacterium QS_5_72_10]